MKRKSSRWFSFMNYSRPTPVIFRQAAIVVDKKQEPADRFISYNINLSHFDLSARE
jgi:hypothetical protein